MYQEPVNFVGREGADGDHAPADWPLWLGETQATPGRLQQLLKPFPAERMQCWPVAKAVGSVKNDGPDLVEPLAS